MTFVWTPSCQQAFDYLKDRLTSALILMLPNFDLQFAVHCDASLSLIGFALTQLLPNGTERVVTYGSRALTPSEHNYTIFELETLSLIFCTQVCFQDPSHRPFTVYTDSRAASFIKSFRLNPQSRRLVRWTFTYRILTSRSLTRKENSTQ